MCIQIFVCMYIYICVVTCKGEKKVSGYLELELQAFVSCPMRVLEAHSGPLKEQLSHLLLNCFYDILKFFVQYILVILASPPAQHNC